MRDTLFCYDLCVDKYVQRERVTSIAFNFEKNLIEFSIDETRGQFHQNYGAPFYWCTKFGRILQKLNLTFKCSLTHNSLKYILR